MSDHYENDDLLRWLGAEDPAAGSDPEAPGEREAVRARAAHMLEADADPKTRQRLLPRLAIAAALLVLAAGVAVILTLGGSSSGPAPALAIEKSQKWVTLRLTDPTASDLEMNQELADAGIDRVRVHSVPGPSKDAGTWAGWAEFQPRCKGWSGRFGGTVDIPTSQPNHHRAEGQFNLTIPSHSGALYSQEVGTPHSESIARLPTDSVNDPRSAAKVLIAVRPRSADHASNAADLGPDQLVALGGVFAQYGNAIKSGQTSCQDFGLKPEPKTPYVFPPPGKGWVVLHVSDTGAGRRRMNRELQSGGIKGKVRLLPVQSQEGTPFDQVGHFLGFQRVPALPKHPHIHGNKTDIDLDESPPNSKKPGSNDVAIRRAAFNALPDARWTFYVGRATRAGERPKIMSLAGPVDAKKALKNNCPGLGISGSGDHKECISGLSLQVPRP
jgi:hypothetical protein